MSTIQVSVRHLRAMIALSAKNDVRYYLNGLCIEASATETRIAATDGHVLGVLRADAENDLDGCDVVTLIIPGEVVRLLKFSPKDAILALVGADAAWSIGDHEMTVGFKPIDARFPNYRAIIPTGKPSYQAAQFNPDLISRFRKVGIALGATGYQTPVIHHNGDTSAALVTIPTVPEFAGVIMPIKAQIGESVVKSSDWARQPIVAIAAKRSARKAAHIRAEA